MTKLKPCPFCGGEVSMYGTSRIKRFTIIHKDQKRSCFVELEFDWRVCGSIADTTEAWNRRVKDEAD